MSNNPLDSYQQIEKATLSGRELEAFTLNKAAAVLQDMRNEWEGPDFQERLEYAIRYNQRLWTVFQAELLEPDNQLPEEVKDNLLSLSAFIDKRTFEIMAHPKPDMLDILIRINRNIAAGLSGMSSQDL